MNPDKEQLLKECLAFLSVWEKFIMFHVAVINFTRNFQNEKVRKLDEFLGIEPEEGRLADVFDYLHQLTKQYTIKMNRLFNGKDEKEESIKARFKELSESIKDLIKA